MYNLVAGSLIEGFAIYYIFIIPILWDTLLKTVLVLYILAIPYLLKYMLPTYPCPMSYVLYPMSYVRMAACEDLRVTENLFFFLKKN